MTSLHDLTVPAFRRGFASLSAILTTGEAFARDTGVAESEMLDIRLIADMAPLTAQVQRGRRGGSGRDDL
jgi:hypothetical protein